MKPIQLLSSALVSSQMVCYSAASLLRTRARDNGDANQSSDRRLDTRIIGGSEAVEDRFSYSVSLQDHIGHFCGGSLIAKDVVLTAAHCAGGQYNIVLGRHDWDDNDGEVIDMKKEVPHPNYNSRTTNNDFMLVFLERAFAVDNVDLVTLNSQPSVPSVGQRCTVMGWGDMDIRDNVSTLSDALMHVNVDVISNSECDASEGTINGYEDNYNNQIEDEMLCAENAGQKDACQGDSGGPLIIKGGDAGSDLQIGVVSWGVGCAHDSFPGVYSRVSSAYDWIENEACKGSYYAPQAGFDCSNVSTGGGVIYDLLGP